jgi:hypothetical protein
LCDGKDGWREDAEREFPSLALLGEREEIFVGASQNVETPDAGLKRLRKKTSNCHPEDA